MNGYSLDSEELALMELTAKGDSAAFTQLYDRHSTLVFSIALKILADREEAQDVLQQVFMKVLNKASLYSPGKGRPAAWLAALARNQSLDRLRQIKSRRLLGEKLYHEASAGPVAGSPASTHGPYPDEVELLHGAMAALRPDELHVLHLAYFGGLSQREISEKLSQPLGSIKARIRRALSKLRGALEGIVELHPVGPAVVPGSGSLMTFQSPAAASRG